MFIFIYRFTLFLFFFTSYISAQPSINLSFEQLSLEDGLSQSTVNTIFQDKKGFLWFGTSNGLNKYDGYNFTIYKHNPFNSTSLSNDIIYSIAEDKEGNLWIATENGLNNYNPSLNKFNTSPNIFNDIAVMSLYLDKDNNLWMGTYGKGLFLLKPDKKTLIEYNNNPSDLKNSPYNFINSINKGKDNTLWLSTMGSLSRFDTKTGEFKNYSYPNSSWNTRTRFNCAYEVQPGLLLVGTEDQGLFYFDIKKETFSSVSGIEAEAIKTIYEDRKENIWVGSYYSGLFLFNKNSKSFSKVSNNNNLSDNSIISIYEDKSGILWFGTLLGGLNKYLTQKKNFTLLRQDPENKNSLINNVIYSVLKDRDGNVWIGTTMGLNRIDNRTGNFKNYNTEKSGLEENYITDIYQDKEGNIWIITGRNFYLYNERSDRFRKINFSINDEWISLPALSVIYEDSKMNFWIGSRIYGLIKFDRKNEKFFQDSLIGNANVMTISEDKDQNILLGTADGLVIYNKDKKDIEKYSADAEKKLLNNNVVFSIYEDDERNIWLGTYGGGLNKFDRKKNKFLYYSETEGLPNNVVYSILPDGKDNLWLSTNKGICRFNTKNNSVRTFDVSDGLQSFEFNQGAAFKSSDGEMFFGGVNGLNRFYPSEIIDNPYPPSIVITSLKNIDKNLLNNLEKEGTIELSYGQNFISFEFVALDYTNPKKNKYAYMLDGFDKGWIYSGNRRYASYTNLEPGEYIFKVKGSNSDDVWNEAGTTFTIIINPPFWRTWWFFTLSLLLIITLVYLIHKYRLRAKINKLVEIEKIRKNIADDFHDELGHKLTKISLYSELMRRNLKEVLNGNEIYLKKINDAANNLYDDTKDFIWSIDPVKDTLYDLAVYLKDFGDELFDKTDIGFMVKEISQSLNVIKLPMNWKRQLILIYKEAMNNILRHSGCKNVELSVELNNDTVFINLFDDGKGFSGISDSTGRGLVNMKNRANRIGGELIIETKEGFGTRITFQGTTKTILN